MQPLAFKLALRLDKINSKVTNKVFIMTSLGLHGLWTILSLKIIRLAHLQTAHCKRQVAHVRLNNIRVIRKVSGCELTKGEFESTLVKSFKFP